MMEIVHNVPPGWGLCPAGARLYPVFMALAFVAAGLVFVHTRRDEVSGDEPNAVFPIALAAFFGGLSGAKLPVVLLNLQQGWSWEALLAGRTIAGGLVGGTLGVLLVKRALGIQGRHGNRFAAPVALGMAVGRIGCLLAGCCAGVPTALPWGIDFGDGVPRHPTQLYEALFCLCAFVFLQRARKTARPGRLLSGFFGAYFVFRFFVEFIRPNPIVAGLTPYQWICAAGVILLFVKACLLSSTPSGGLQHERT